MKIIVLTIALLLLQAPAFSCDEKWVQSVKGNGQIIILQDGSVWKSLDPITSSIWLPASEVLDCYDGNLINTDDGESIPAVRIR